MAAMYPTPALSHHNPHRRYHAVVILGTDTKALIATPQVATVQTEQHLFSAGTHAFTVEQTVPGIRI